LPRSDPADTLPRVGSERALPRACCSAWSMPSTGGWRPGRELGPARLERAAEGGGPNVS